MLLRFNVWSKVTGEWLDPEDYVVDGCGQACCVSQDYGELLPAVEIEVCLFTGVLDGNGKEICEGDILACAPDELLPEEDLQYCEATCEVGGILVVEWDEEEGGFTVWDRKGGCYGNLLEVKGSIVVGNKFEHPFWFAEDFGRPAK